MRKLYRSFYVRYSLYAFRWFNPSVMLVFVELKLSPDYWQLPSPRLRCASVSTWNALNKTKAITLKHRFGFCKLRIHISHRAWTKLAMPRLSITWAGFNNSLDEDTSIYIYSLCILNYLFKPWKPWCLICSEASEGPAGKSKLLPMQRSKAERGQVNKYVCMCVCVVIHIYR